MAQSPNIANAKPETLTVSEQRSRLDRCYPSFEQLRSELIPQSREGYQARLDTGEYCLDRDPLKA
ncbi:MAG TPA: hypothetical protein VL134_09900 [Leptolyngbya sp.]|nr:hypothetical protein [Leptolyngbya sp.]